MQQARTRTHAVQGAVQHKAGSNARLPTMAAAAGWQRQRHQPAAALLQAVWLQQRRHSWARCVRLRALHVEAPSEGGLGLQRRGRRVLLPASEVLGRPAVGGSRQLMVPPWPVLPALPCSAVSGGGVGAA